MSTSRKKRGYLVINGRKNPVFEGVNPIGRQRQSTVILLDHTVSHQQAMIIIIKGNHYLCDLNSCNGTSIDHVRLKPLEIHEITDKQNLCFGNVKAAYEILVPGEDVAQDHQLSQINEDVFSLQTQRFDMSTGSQNTVDSRAIGDHLQFDDCVTLKSTESRTMEGMDVNANAEDVGSTLAQISNTTGDRMKNSSPEQSFHDMPTQIVHYDEGPSCSYSNFSNGNLGNSIYDMPTQIDDPDLDFEDCRVNKSSKQHNEDSNIHKLDVQETLINDVPTQIVANADEPTITSNKLSIHNLPTQVSNGISSSSTKSKQDQSSINELPTQIIARPDQAINTSTKQSIHNLPTQLSNSIPSSPTKLKQNQCLINERPIQIVAGSDQATITSNKQSIHNLPTQVSNSIPSSPTILVQNPPSINEPKQLSSILTLPTEMNETPEAEKDHLINELPTQVASPCDDTQVLESDLETTNIDNQSVLVEDTVVNDTVYNKTADHNEDSNDSIDFMTMLPTTQVFESQGMLQVSHFTRKDRNVIGSDDDNSHKSSVDDVNMPCSLQTSLLKRKVKNIITSDEERKTQSTQSGDTDVDDIPASQATQDNLKTSLLKRKVRNLIVSDDDLKINKKPEESSDETDIEVVPKKVLDSSSSEDDTPLSTRKKKLRKRASPVLNKYNSDSETDVENPSPSRKISRPNTKLTDAQNNPTESNTDAEKSESTLVPAGKIETNQAKPPTQISDDNTDVEDHIGNDMNDSDLIPNTQGCFSGMKSIISQSLRINKQTQDLTNFTEASNYEESIDGSLNLMLTESMDVTKSPPGGSQNGQTRRNTENFNDEGSRSPNGSTSQNGTKACSESQKNVEVVSSDLSISSSSKDTIIDNTTGHHILINKNNATEEEDDIFLKPTQCIQEPSTSKEHNIPYYDDVLDLPTQCVVEPSPKRNNNQEADNDQSLLDEDDDIFMKATQCIKEPSPSNLNDDTNPSKSPVPSYSSPKSRLKIDLQVTSTSVGDLSNNPDFQDDIFMQATQATDSNISGSKSVLIAERNPVDDDIFLQATQQLPVESNTADDDIFLQATQPVATTSSSPFEFKKPALNSSFEKKRHNIRIRYDLSNKIPDDRCHDNVEENLKNMFESQPVGDDDVFLQPTQEVQNKVEDDIFSQPTQPVVLLQPTQEVEKNDDDIFNQPTQQVVCFPRMSTQPSIESQMELVFGGQTASPIFPRCDGRPQNPLANILETLQSQHEIIIPSDDVADAETIIDEERVKPKSKKKDSGKSDKKKLMKKKAKDQDEESGQIADTLQPNNDKEESGNFDSERSGDHSPELVGFAKSVSPIPEVKAGREKSSRRKATSPPLEVDQSGTGNNKDNVEKKKSSRSSQRNTPSPATVLLAKPKRNTPSSTAVGNTKPDNLHVKPSKRAHVTIAKEETKNKPTISKTQNAEKFYDEEPSVITVQELETIENDDKEIQRTSPTPDITSLSPRSGHSTTSSSNKEALSTKSVPKTKKSKSTKGKHPTDLNEILDETSPKKAGLPDSREQSAKSTDIPELDSFSSEPTSKTVQGRAKTGSKARPGECGRPKRSHGKRESTSPEEQMGKCGTSDTTNETREMSPKLAEEPNRSSLTDIQDIDSAEHTSKKTRGRSRAGRETSPEEKSKPKRNLRKEESTSPGAQQAKSGTKEASNETTANELPSKLTGNPSSPSGDVETVPARRSKRKPSVVPSTSPQRLLSKTESRVDVKETPKLLFVETAAKQMPGRSSQDPITQSGGAKKTDILESGSPEYLLKRGRGRPRAVREASPEETSRPKRSLRKQESTSPEAQVGKSRTREAANETTAKEMPGKSENPNSPSGDVETVLAQRRKRKHSVPSTSPQLHLAKTESRVDTKETTSKQLTAKSAEVPSSPSIELTPARRSKRKSSADKFVKLKKHRIDDELSLIEEVPESSTVVDLTHCDSVEEVNAKSTRGRKASQSTVRSVVASLPSTSKSDEDSSVTTGKRGRQKHRRQSATSEDDFVVKPTKKRSRLDTSAKDPSQSSNMSDSILSSSGMPETPERAKRKLKPKVVFTMMDSPDLESLIRRLGGSVVDSVDQCTVLVTCNVKRSQKLLSAVGQGKPVCSSSWLDGCRKANKFLDPWDHIILDAEAEKKWNFSLKESLNRSSRKKLLENFTFLVLVTAAQDVLKGAIESCGGKCVLRAPGKYTGELVVVSSEEIKSKHAKYLKANPKPFIVVPEAVFDGVLRQEMNFEKYKLA